MTFFNSFQFLLIMKMLLYLAGRGETEESCPETPMVLIDYVSYRAQDIAEPYHYTILYWTGIRDWCEDGEGDYYEIHSCNQEDCSDYSSVVKAAAKFPRKTISFRPQDTWLYVKIRAVNKDGNQSDWSEIYVVDLKKLNPEPYVLFFTYVVDKITTDRFQGNPYGLYVQPDFTGSYNRMPARLAKQPWPAFFDYECCDSEGITVFPAEPEALYFQLTDEILKLQDKLYITGQHWVSFDWISVRHFMVAKIDGHYYIYKIDDSELIQTGDAKKSILIYHTSNRIYQLLYNAFGTLLIWTEETNDIDSKIAIKVKFMEDQEQPLVTRCPCASKLNITSAALEFDWRPFYENNGTAEPGLLFVANDSLWRTNSVSDQCTCEMIVDNMANLTGTDASIVQISADWSYFYWLNGANGHLKGYKWETGEVQTLWNDETISELGQITQFKATGAELKPFSPTQCYFPTFKNVTARMTSKTEAVVSLDLNWDDSELCSKIPKPPVDFSIGYALVENRTDLDNLSCELLECKTLEFTWSREIIRKQVPLKHLIFNKTYFLYATVSPTDQYPKPFKPYSQEADFDKQLFSSLYVPDIRKHIPVKAIVGGVILLLLLFAVLVCFLVIYFRKYRPFKDIPRVWPYQLKTIGKISEGNFGEVWREEFKNKIVAVKYLKPSAGDYEERCFLQEIRIMWCVKGPYVVELLGICLTSRPYRMVLEYIEGETLIKHLRNLKVEKYSDTVYSYLQREDEKDLMKAMHDTIKACVHLEDLGILHRDLAGRNVMIIYNPGTNRIDQAKLIDFGLAKEIDTSEGSYKVPQGVYRELPAALFSPEAFCTWVFTPKTEVWAFGVLLWETFSLGDTPYGGKTYEEIQNFLTDGWRLPRPHHCSSDRLHSLIESCWDADPKKRPDFKIIQNEIEDILKHPFKPAAVVYPQPLRSVSEQSAKLKKVAMPVLKSDTSSPSPLLGVPSQAYAEMRITENPQADELKIIEDPKNEGIVQMDQYLSGESPQLVVKYYRGSENEKRVPLMTGAYVAIATTEEEKPLPTNDVAAAKTDKTDAERGEKNSECDDSSPSETRNMLSAAYPGVQI